MRHDARQGGRNQGLLQRSDRRRRIQPHDRRFPRHEQPQRPRADLRERRNVPKESGAEIGERHRRQGLREAEDIERCLLNGVAADVGFIQDREEMM